MNKTPWQMHEIVDWGDAQCSCAEWFIAITRLTASL